MPMGNVSTHCINRKKMNMEEREGISLHDEPRKSTLDFLRQFARVYSVESSLDTDISGFVLN